MVHIKAVTIDNFKSYRGQTTIQLDSGYNVIVGNNGHGKSNLLWAIEFACAPQQVKPSMSKEILNTHNSRTVAECSVELLIGSNPGDDADPRLRSVFDNRREIQFSRTMNASGKDSYRMNGKAIRPDQYKNKLNTLGFTDSMNPYYIVRQHRVGNIAEFTDKQRYDLIADAAGITSHEQKIKESRTELAKSIEKANQSNEALKTCDKKLSLLLEESKEAQRVIDLQSKIDFSRERIRALYHEKRLKKRDQAERFAKEVNEKHATEQRRKEDCEEEMTRLEEDRERLQNELIMAEELQNKSRMSLSEALSEKDRTESQLKLVRDELDTLANQTKAKRATLDTYTKEKFNMQAHQSVVSDDLVSQRKIMNELEESLMKVTATAAALKERAATAGEARYASLDDRNFQLQKSILKKEAEQTDANEKIAVDNAKLGKLKEEEAAYHRRIEDLMHAQSEIPSPAEELNKFKEARESVHAKTLKTKRELDHIDRTMANLRNRHQDKYKDFGCSVAVSEALRCIEETIRRDPSLKDKCYGTLLENVYLKPMEGTNHKPFNAVDAAGGNQLDNYLVADKHVVRVLKDAIAKHNRERNKNARLTIVPLEQIGQRNANQRTRPVPTGALRLTEQLEYDTHIRPAVEQVFGKYLLVEKIEKAFELQRDPRAGHAWDYVDIQGSLHGRDGVTQGGQLRERCQNAENCINSMAEAKKYEDQRRKLEAENDELKLENIKLMEQNTLVNVRTEELKSQVQRYEEDIYRARSELKPLCETITILERRVLQSRKNMQQADNLLNNLRQDLLRPDLEFTKADAEKLDEETAKLELLMENKNVQSTKIDELTEQLELAGIKLDELNPVIEDLTKELDNLDCSTLSSAVTTATIIRNPSDTIQDQYNQLSRDLEEAQMNLTNATQTKDAADVTLKDIKRAQGRLVEATKKARDTYEKCKTHYQTIDQQKQESQQRLQTAIEATEQLTAMATTDPSLMQADVSELQTMTLEELRNELDNMTESLSELGDRINHGAVEELRIHQSAFEKHKMKYDKLMSQTDLVRDLIRQTEEKKEKGFNEAFDRVSKGFRSIFKEIVPGGDAQLLLPQSKPLALMPSDANALATPPRYPNNANHRSSDITDKENLGHVESIGIKVTFTGPKSWHRMEQLSGGQRTVVAAALLFALQRGQAAPVYLLDEIDAALDEQYRSKVADVMFASSKHSQFIMTTFGREVARRGDQFIYVKLDGKESKHRIVSKEAALSMDTFAELPQSSR